LLIMISVLCLAATPVQFLQTEVTLAKGESWTRDFILAPGDSLKVQASYLRQVGSSCGCLGGLGDVFMRKGDNVGRAAISEWHGDVVTSAYEQYRPEVVYYSDHGGAFTLTVENHSGHRTNVYSIAAWRIPTQMKYAEFDGSFHADTSHETTWVVEPVYKTVKDTSYKLHKWTDTLYDEKPAKLKQATTTLYRGILQHGSNQSEVNFLLPDNSTGKVGFALCTDSERLRQLQEESRRKWQAAKTASMFVPDVGAALGVAMGLISAVANSGDGAFTYYLVDDEGRAGYNAGQPFRSYDNGERVSDALFTRELQPGKMYYLELYNPSKRDKAVVAYQIATILKEPRLEKHSETVPVVSVRQVQTGNRRVPSVKMSITPHLPWSQKGQP